MIYATLSADIVKSTSLSTKDTFRLRNYLQLFINKASLENKGVWGRIIKGDELELVATNPNSILRIALLLKCYIRMFNPEDSASKVFKKYGIRIAIGIGELRINDKLQGIIDGDAIYLSGRGLSELSESKTDYFLLASKDSSLSGLDIICSLLDVLINNATARQCEILYYRLQKKNEYQIAEILGIKQATVNGHSTSISWNTISKAVSYFEDYNFNITIER